MGSNVRGFLAAILLVVGIVAVVAGYIYLTHETHSLPSFFPGHVTGGTGKHTHRGIAGVVVGGVLVVISLVLLATGRKGRQSR